MYNLLLEKFIKFNCYTFYGLCGNFFYCTAIELWNTNYNEACLRVILFDSVINFGFT